VKTSVPPPTTVTFPSSTRRGSTLQRGYSLTAIDENPPSPPSSDDTDAEFGGNPGNVKSRNTRTRRKSIKQIVMRITTTPTSAGEKVKLKTIRDPPPMPVTLSPESLMPLEPPPGTRFEKLGSASVPSLPSTKETSGLARSNTRFKSIRKRWNAVFATVRR